MPPAAPDDAELGAWLHLLHSPGVGREAARRLLARFLSPQAAIDEIRRCSGTQFDPAIVEAFLRCQPEMEQAGRWNA